MKQLQYLLSYLEYLNYKKIAVQKGLCAEQAGRLASCVQCGRQVAGQAVYQSWWPPSLTKN